MQTIPETILDQITEHAPQFVPMVQNLRAGLVPAVQAEKAIADGYLELASPITARETWDLSYCCRGLAYGGSDR